MLTENEKALWALIGEAGRLEQIGRSSVESRLPGITIAQFGMLDHLAREPQGWAPIELARHFGITKQTMTTTLVRLSKANLIRVEINANRRGKRVWLTENGRDIHARCVRQMGPAFAHLADQAPANLVSHLLPRLRSLCQSLAQA